MESLDLTPKWAGQMSDQKPEKKTLVVRGGLVIVRDLAAALGNDSSNTLKDLKKKGFDIQKRRSKEARGQAVSVLTIEDVKRYLSERNKELFEGQKEIDFLEVEG